MPKKQPVKEQVWFIENGSGIIREGSTGHKVIVTFACNEETAARIVAMQKVCLDIPTETLQVLVKAGGLRSLLEELHRSQVAGIKLRTMFERLVCCIPEEGETW